MFTRVTIFFLFLLITFPAIAQQPRVIRYHEYSEDSSAVVDNNQCYFIRGVRIIHDKETPIRVYDLSPGETDVIFFELKSGAPLQVAFELKKNTSKVKNPERIWVSNYYKMSSRKSETRDFVTGELTLKRVKDTAVILNGKLNIDTDYPVTHQEILFNEVKLKVSKISEVVKIEDDKHAAERREDDIALGLSSIITGEKKILWDSIFSVAKYPNRSVAETLIVLNLAYENLRYGVVIEMGDDKCKTRIYAGGYATTFVRDTTPLSVNRADVDYIAERIKKKLEEFLATQH